MKYKIVMLCLLVGIGIFGYRANKKGVTLNVNSKQPPTAERILHKLENHGVVRQDYYYWMRERDNPKTIAYLKAENEHMEATIATEKERREKIFQELKGRIKQEDTSVPIKIDNYFYYTRTVTGGEYAVICRRKGSMEAPEEILLDGNKEAIGKDFYAIGSYSISPNHRYFAYATDIVGRRLYTIYIKDLETGKIINEPIAEVTGNLVWAEDNQTLLYSKQDPVTLRWDKILRHNINTEKSELVYFEPDETYYASISKSRSRKFLFINLSSTLTSETRYISAQQPTATPKVFSQRTKGVEYSIGDAGDRFFIVTNHKAKNFRLMETSYDRTALENWQEVIPHRSETFLKDVEVFKDFYVVEEKTNGISQMLVRFYDDRPPYYLKFKEDAYVVYTTRNPNFDTNEFRYGYESMTSPESTFAHNIKTQKETLLKEEEIPSGYDSSAYKSERIFVTARDGKKVPVILVYRKDLRKPDRGNPLLLYGYGSYGVSIEPYFRRNIISLLDRGFIFAVAQVRGGGDLGRAWYYDGRQLKKMNTFHDFIDCAEYLIDKKYAAQDRLFAMGGSAGGLLMGVVANLRPDLFKGIIAQVPFVDVVTTMLDDSIPLTTNEYDEWGNPNDKTYFDYMLSYSPYDNVKVQAYPHMLVTSGLHDSQVQYWEPTKWTAKLRHLKTDNNLLLLKTNMEAGHGGASGRFKRLEEVALQYSFLLMINEM